MCVCVCVKSGVDYQYNTETQKKVTMPFMKVVIVINKKGVSLQNLGLKYDYSHVNSLDNATLWKFYGGCITDDAIAWLTDIRDRLGSTGEAAVLEVEAGIECRPPDFVRRWKK